MTGALLTPTMWPFAASTTTTGWTAKAMAPPESEGSVVKASLVAGPVVDHELPGFAARALNAADAGLRGAMARAMPVNSATTAVAAEPVAMRTLPTPEATREKIESSGDCDPPVASPGSGPGPGPAGTSRSCGGAGAGGLGDVASTAPMASATTVRSTQSSRERNAPVPTQIDGSPIHGISRQPIAMMSDREIGVLSGLGLASPAVTSVPSLLAATRRCSTRLVPAVTRVPSLSAATRRCGTAALLADPGGVWNVMTRPMGVGASASSGRDRTTSPMLMCGSIEPLWTTEPVRPKSIGARAQAARAARKTR